MADYPIDKILNTLNQASIQQKQPAIYQAIHELIKASRANQVRINVTEASNTSQGDVNKNMTFLTVTDETATLASSRRLVGGVGINLDTSVTAVESVNLELHPFLFLGA